MSIPAGVRDGSGFCVSCWSFRSLATLQGLFIASFIGVSYYLGCISFISYIVHHQHCYIPHLHSLHHLYCLSFKSNSWYHRGHGRLILKAFKLVNIVTSPSFSSQLHLTINPPHPHTQHHHPDPPSLPSTNPHTLQTPSYSPL